MFGESCKPTLLQSPALMCRTVLPLVGGMGNNHLMVERWCASARLASTSHPPRSQDACFPIASHTPSPTLRKDSSPLRTRCGWSNRYRQSRRWVVCELLSRDWCAKSVAIATVARPMIFLQSLLAGIAHITRSRVHRPVVLCLCARGEPALSAEFEQTGNASMPHLAYLFAHEGIAG